jgi:cation diffusion facilitator CzcD-associated flavoprotein CzcO
VTPTAAHEVDCIIYGTGFQVADPPRGAIIGRGGVTSSMPGATARMRISAPRAGFRTFMIIGPNTGLGHNSMVFMIESQIDMLGALRAMQRNAPADRRAPVVEALQQRIQGS